MVRSRFTLLLAALAVCAPLAHADILPTGDPAPDGLGFRVNPSGWDFIESEFESLVDPNSLLTSLNQSVPIEVIDSCLFLISADITSFTDVSWSSLNLDLIPVNGGLTVDFTISDPVIAFILAGDWLLCLDSWDCTSSIEASSLTLSATGNLSIQANGRFDFSVTGVSSNLNNLNFESESDCAVLEFLVDIVDDLFGLISGTFEDATETLIRDQLPPVVEGFLNDIPFDGNILLLDEPFSYILEPATLNLTTSGSTVFLDTALAALDPTDCAPPLAGSEFTPSGLPAINASPGSDVGLTLSDDFLNQLMLATYDAGLLCFTIDQTLVDSLGVELDLNTTLLLLFAPDLFFAYPEAPILLVAEPNAAPVISIGPNGSNILDLTLPDLGLDVYVFGEDRWIRAFRIETTLDLSGGLEIEPDNTLQVIVNTVDATVLVSFEELLDIDDTLVTTFLEPLLEILLPQVFGVLDSFQLPSFEGFQLVLNTIVPDGPAGDYASLYADLVSLAPAPAEGPGVDLSTAVITVEVVRE